MKTPNRISSRRCLTSPSPLRFLAFLLMGLCLTVGTVLAGDKVETKRETKKEAKLDQKKKSESGEKSVITGSLIPQKVKPNRIPVTTSPVIIIGQKDIERSGGATVSEVLRRQGASR
jgi:outer membrane cobalamin receptor